jgi:hypothetical protein
MSNDRSNGLSTVGVTQVVFVILWLTDLIHWPWPWVFVPIWGPIGTILIVVSVGYVIGGLTTGIENRLRLRRMHRELLDLKGKRTP